MQKPNMKIFNLRSSRTVIGRLKARLSGVSLLPFIGSGIKVARKVITSFQRSEFWKMSRLSEDTKVIRANDASDVPQAVDDEEPEDRDWKVEFSEMLPNEKTFENVCGFRLDDLKSYEKFVALMYRPTDPASLGVARAFFGKFNQLI